MSVYARLNHGTWLAECPDCNGAEVVHPGHKFVCGHPDHGKDRQDAFYLQLAILEAERSGAPFIHSDDPLIGIRLDTATAKVTELAGDFFYDVIWPTAGKKKSIEVLAAKRPKTARNWPVVGDKLKGVPFDFDESITAMRDENESHGLGRSG